MRFDARRTACPRGRRSRCTTAHPATAPPPFLPGAPVSLARPDIEHGSDRPAEHVVADGKHHAHSAGAVGRAVHALRGSIPLLEVGLGVRHRRGIWSLGLRKVNDRDRSREAPFAEVISTTGERVARGRRGSEGVRRARASRHSLDRRPTTITCCFALRPIVSQTPPPTPPDRDDPLQANRACTGTRLGGQQ